MYEDVMPIIITPLTSVSADHKNQGDQQNKTIICRSSQAVINSSRSEAVRGPGILHRNIHKRNGG